MLLMFQSRVEVINAIVSNYSLNAYDLYTDANRNVRRDNPFAFDLTVSVEDFSTGNIDKSYNAGTEKKPDPDQREGQPVNITPWAFNWRADASVQEKPEAYFIPRRLERIDKVYRTAYYELPENELKSIHYNMPDLLNPLLPKPKGQLVAGLLWTGGLSDYQIELIWPTSVLHVPSPGTVEVRVYPTSFGWFGWTVDKILGKPEISEDSRTWTYKSEPGGKMDWAFSARVDAATEMVAVFNEESGSAVPEIRVTSQHVGVWKRMDVEIEWGFQEGTEKNDFNGRLDSYMAITGTIMPLAKDKGTKVQGENSWQSKAAVRNKRKGVIIPVLFASGDYPGLDSRITVINGTDGFTIRICDLEKGPILIPEHGIFITKTGSGISASQFVIDLEAKNLKSIRELVREHRESRSWEEVMREVRLSTCPPGTELKPFPETEDPPMLVQVPDTAWTNAWRVASVQLKGRHMWGGLAYEVGIVARQMNMAGLHDEADKIYQYFLEAPGAKSDGDFIDGAGAFEYAKEMRHDMGYSHDGTHASTGRLLFSMSDRYFLTGDREWFLKNRVRMQEAADWIIRQRNLYMNNIPNRHDLLVAGLLPPSMLGDYAIPSSDWRWYYSDNSIALQGLKRFADVLKEFDEEAGLKYSYEADAFRRDILRAVEKETVLSPVRLQRDGTYCSFIPTMAYSRGLMINLELGYPQRPQTDVVAGSLPLAEPFAVLDAMDDRMIGTLNVMEEVAMVPEITKHVTTINVKEKIGRYLGPVGELDEKWFWNCYGGSFPKGSYNSKIYLLQDDVPNFLRFWMNSYAALVGADGKLWEWQKMGSFDNCTHPDNGTAGWFLENFRNILVMEEGKSLWIAKATPRVWLEQGKKITISNAPTYFGTLAYEIVSDVDNNKITAIIEIPDRTAPESVLLRFRHPMALPLKSVIINDKEWTDFDNQSEIIKINGLKGTVFIIAYY